MFEIFMAICALTLLECGNVTVAYEQLPDDNWHAVAGYDLDGNYYIIVDPAVQNKSDKFKRQLMVHEIAHLIAFDLDSANTTHYGIYEEICHDLQQLAEVPGRHTCKPFATPPPYPWRDLRRE